MTIKVGINGFGRIGRLAMRVAFDWDDIDIIQINDPIGDATTLAHLLAFDSIHGRWHHEVSVQDEILLIKDQRITCSQNSRIQSTDWSACDVVIEASGKHNRKKILEDYLTQGVKRVVVTAPVKEDGVLNVVMGINDYCLESGHHSIVTAASCTTNCLAPIVQVIHQQLGIEHGSITTIHDITNTQSILDTVHKDLRRARACGTNLIPTTTGSATAITHIFPELEGKLNGHAVRVPIANASLTDCVFEVSRETSIDEVNALLATAADNELKGILAYEERPLVSSDYKTDPHSCTIDALSTMVVDGTQVKIFAWYDNEWGYANRTAELMRRVGQMDQN